MSGRTLSKKQCKALAYHLRCFVETERMTQVELAHKLRVTQSMVSKVLSGEDASPSIGLLCRIREETGLTLDELLGYSGEVPPSSKNLLS